MIEFDSIFTCIIIMVFMQLELPRPIPRNSVESDHRCTSRINFDNADDNVTLHVIQRDADVTETILTQ